MTSSIAFSAAIDFVVQGSASVKKPSGNTSFDEAARRAVESTGSLPKPPPRFTDGLIATLKFTGKECQ